YDVACLCLQNLYYFLDFVTCCYSKHYEYKPYNKDLLRKNSEISVHSLPEYQEIDLKALIAENQALKEQLTARREEQKQTYVPKPLDLSEYKTRKIYIDTMLMDAGWTEGKNWINEVELPGMPN